MSSLLSLLSSCALTLVHLTTQHDNDDNDDAVALAQQCRRRRHHPYPCPRIAVMTATHTVPMGIPMLGYTLG